MIPNRETEEKRQHSTPLVPYSFYEVRIPEALNNVPMHWHSEFELNRILGGAGEFICGKPWVFVNLIGGVHEKTV